MPNKSVKGTARHSGGQSWFFSQVNGSATINQRAAPYRNVGLCNEEFPNGTFMKKTIFLYPAIFFCLNSNASTDFACSAETPNGVVQISTPSHTSSVVNDFFSTKPHSIRVYVEGNEIDVSQTTIAKKDGWFVVRKDGGKQIVIAFRKVKSQPVSPSADIKYFSSEGKQRIVRAECFDG